MKIYRESKFRIGHTASITVEERRVINRDISNLHAYVAFSKIKPIRNYIHIYDCHEIKSFPKLKIQVRIPCRKMMEFANHCNPRCVDTETTGL